MWKILQPVKPWKTEKPQLSVSPTLSVRLQFTLLFSSFSLSFPLFGLHVSSKKRHISGRSATKYGQLASSHYATSIRKNTSCTLVHGISFKSSPRGLWRHPDVWFPSAGPHSRLCTALRFAPQASVSQKWIEQTLCYLDRGYWRCFIYTWGFP